MSDNGAGFVNLHNHSDYSKLDGYSHPAEYLKRAAQLGQRAVAITDHGNLYGAMDFLMAARALSKSVSKSGGHQDPIFVKPIVGIEAYMAPENPDGAACKKPIFYSQDPERRHDDVARNGSYLHLTLLAINDVGFHNLIKLSTESYRHENFYSQPRMDMSMLSKWNEGIVAFTGCPSGEVQTRLRLGQKDKAYEYAQRMSELFPGRYFVEIMLHRMEKPLERDILPKLLQLSKDLKLPLVATNDAHYALPEDAVHQAEMLCINTNANGGKKVPKSKNGEKVKKNFDRTVYMDDEISDNGGPRFAFSGDDYYLKSEAEMLRQFPEDEFPGAVRNTVRIADMVGDWWAADDFDVQSIKDEYGQAIKGLPHLHGGIADDKAESGKGVMYLSETKDEDLGEPIEVSDGLQEAINSGEVSLGGYDISLNDDLRPVIDIPDGWTEEQWFKKKINDGFEAKRVARGDSPETLMESKRRIAAEYPVFAGNDFIQYMLVVQDYITWAREHGIAVGWGRGSVGGSEIAYLMDISRVDPIKYDLLFERFLNPERLSPPDVDTDFQSSRRDEVLTYVREKYGDDHVANIITFGTFKCRQAFRDVAKIYHMSNVQTNAISKLIPDPIPDDNGTKHEATMSAMYDENSPFYEPATDFRKALANGGEKWSKIAAAAASLEGRMKSVGTHACGVIMSRTPIWEHAPMYWNPNNKNKDPWVECRVQWTYKQCESIGLIKMDFLALSELDNLASTLKNITTVAHEQAISGVKGKRIIVPDLDELSSGDMDDPDTYKMLAQGDSAGIFQLNQPNVQNMLRSMKPTEFEDIVSINALDRPGPMNMGAHEQYFDRKNGREPAYVVNETLDKAFKGTPVETVLKPTYGLCLYQEQVMQISRSLCGYTRGQADSLRAAMGHKIHDEMLKNKTRFIEGALKNNEDGKWPYQRKDVEELWSFIEAFSSYSFNRSHSVAYAIISYLTSYLKCHYPSEYMAALMTENLKNKPKLRALLQNVRSSGMDIGAIDVNTSQPDISAVLPLKKGDPSIVFGFSTVSGVNQKVGETIVESRNTKDKGRFSSFDDFLDSVPSTVLSKKVIENLAIAGAFDSLGVGRKAVADNVDAILKSENTLRKVKVKITGGLFSNPETMVNRFEVPKTPELPYVEKLGRERDLLGVYVSGTPLDHLGDGLGVRMRMIPEKSAPYTTISAIRDWASNLNGKWGAMKVTLAGILLDLERKTLKSGSGSWYKCSIQDSTGYVEARISGKAADSIALKLGSEPNEDTIYEIQGRADGRGNVSIYDLEVIDTDVNGAVPLYVRVNAGASKTAKIKQLRSEFEKRPGSVPVIYDVRTKTQTGHDYRLVPGGHVSLGPEDYMAYEDIVGQSRLCSWSDYRRMQGYDQRRR